ncbi:hypothetical protein FHW23_002016 [Curtobacterium pusillum]|uniref:PH domain-containing protein n=1 Tax=Curtobacterium pusillum TaxID=69373 RepID=A0AAW3T729_9MICO|nr:hypothetical protein [Curtobacterium pusillum]MBA8990751.1 hypothetical protein [Curtobacterium pusillum]
MNDPQQTARQQLRPDEHLYWAGVSDTAKLFGPRDGFLVPFSLLWTGFIVYSLVGFPWNGNAGPAVIVPAAMVIVGLHLVFGRFLVKVHRKRTTVYAVTDRRALIITPRGSREVPVSRPDRTITWSGGRRHCSVEWNSGDSTGVTAFLGGAATARIYANTGLDGLFGPQVFAFWDVRDGEELARELDRASR